MSYTALSVQQVGESGGTITTGTVPTGSGNGYAFQNDGRTFLYLQNDGTEGSATVTVNTGAELAGKAVADVTCELGTGVVKIAGPFPVNVFNEVTGDNRGKVTFSVSGDGSADVIAGAFR